VQRQSELEDPYPGGAVRIIAMSKMDGTPLYPTYLRGDLILSPEDVEIIRKQILETLQYVFFLLFASSGLLFLSFFCFSWLTKSRYFQLQGWDGALYLEDAYYNKEKRQM
jgi:hypothetical protein